MKSCRMLPRRSLRRKVLLAAACGIACHSHVGAATRVSATSHRHARSSKEDPATVSDKTAGRLNAVIDTLKDILTSVQKSEEKESANYDLFIQWCTTQLSDVGQALSQATFENEQSTVQSKELTATITNLKHALGEIDADTTEAQDTMAQAQNVRDDENAKYEEDMQMNMQSIRQVDDAIHIVGKVQNQGGFLQANGAVRRLQLNEPGESSYIFGIMQQLKERLEKTKHQLMSEEQEKAAEAASFASLKTSQVSALGVERSQKSQLLTESKVSLVGASKHAEKTSKEIDELGTLKEETEDQCEAKKDAWKVRCDDREKEKAAINQAVNYLQESISDLQVAQSNRKSDRERSLLQNKQADSEDDSLEDDAGEDKPDDDEEEREDAVEPVPSFVQVRRAPLAFAHQAPAMGQAGIDLLAVANQELGAMSLDAGSKVDFGPAKTVVTNLIKTLQTQQSDEEVKSKYCKGELKKKDDEKMSLSDDISGIQANIDFKKATRQTLTNEINDLNNAIAQGKTQLESAKKIRTSENSAYEEGKKDKELAVKVLRQAMEVLAGFYGGSAASAALMMKGHSLRKMGAPPEVAVGDSAKGAQGFNAIQIIEKLVEDFAKELKDAKMQEEDAVTTIEQLEKDTKNEFDATMQEITDRVKTKAKLVVQLNNEKETKTQKQSDLDAVNDQITSLHSQCDDLLSNYEKRTKARNFEIAQLRDVVDILSGASGATRTGFLEQPPESLSKKEQALLQEMSRAATGLASRVHAK